MLKRLLALSVGMVCIALATVSAHALTIGDPAPSLTVKKFVKGTPVAKFEKGKLYVVEFWATWCGPCKVSIPHLTEMQKKFKDVTFVGVSVWERDADQASVPSFVEQMGAKMDYRVAMDSIPSGKTPQEGFMATNWMQAAQQNGIPTAFVIDKESRIAWIGHPMTMEEPLTKIAAGNWDIKVEAEKLKKQQAAAEKMQELGAKINPALQAKDFAKALSIVNDAIAETPELEETLAPFKFGMLQQLKKTAEAAEYGNKLIATTFKDNAAALNQIAWGIVDPAKKPKPGPMVDMALKAAKRADAISNMKDPAIADTLGAAYFAAGNTAKAIEVEQRAVTLAKGTEMEKDLQTNLATYKAAGK